MQYREIGNSNIEVSVITFGAWAIGSAEFGDPTREDARAALFKAYDMGCTSIDTAPAYCMGFSEEIVGEIVSNLQRDKIQIFTKCGVIWGGENGRLVNECDLQGKHYKIYNYAGKESIIKECENSLRRLKTDYIDLYSLHWPDYTTPSEETAEALNQLLAQGKIRAIGVCNHSLEKMKELEAFCPIVSNKARYSMLNLEIESDLLPYAETYKKGILAYSVLQRGILTGNVHPKFLWPEDNHWEVALYEPENQCKIKAFLNKLRPLASDKGVTLTQLCIRWTIDRPGITIALLGASNPEQVQFDLKAMDVLLSIEETNYINSHLKELHKELNLEQKAVK